MGRRKGAVVEASGDYWERAALADINATTIVTAGELADDARRADLIGQFVRAFQVRSTLRNRMSVIDNYRDLSRLLLGDQDRPRTRSPTTWRRFALPAPFDEPRRK